MLLILLIVIVSVMALPQVGQTMWSTQDVDGAEHELALLNERWTLDGSRLQGMLSNERDMLLWPGLGDPPLVRSGVAFCTVSMSTSFDAAPGTAWVAVRVSDVAFAVYGGEDEVDNVEVLDVSVLTLLREAAWMEEGENKDVSF